MRHEIYSPKVLLISTATAIVVACGGDSGPKVSEKVINADAVATLLGTYDKKNHVIRKEEWYRIEISAEKIRCNHSNHEDKFTSHPYSLARAVDGSYLLLTGEGSFVAKYDADGDKWDFDATGICEWGIDGPYVQETKLQGSPSIAIHDSLLEKMNPKTAKLEEEIKLPGGVLTLSSVKRGTWEDDRNEVDVLDLKLKVENTSKVFTDFLLPTLLDDALSGELVTVSCNDGDATSKGIGNPSFKSHREPVFAQGGGWTKSYAPIAPGKSRSGYLTVIMTKRAKEDCKISIDTAALGGGVVNFEVPDL